MAILKNHKEAAKKAKLLDFGSEFANYKFSKTRNLKLNL